MSAPRETIPDEGQNTSQNGRGQMHRIGDDAAVRRVGYARKSSGGQDLSTQIELLQAAGVTDIRQETGSGAKSDRPVFHAVQAEALAAAQGGEAVEVVVVRLDRWGRSLPDVVTSLTAFSEAGVRFRSLTESGVTLDGSPSSLLVISVLAAAASYERTLMMNRVAEAKKAKGKAAQGGRPRLLTERQVARAKSLIHDEGLSTSAAASAVGVSRRTLNRYLVAQWTRPQETCGSSRDSESSATAAMAGP